MKKQLGKVVEAPSKLKVSKSANKRKPQPTKAAAGKNETPLVHKNGFSSPSVSDEGNCPAETMKGFSTPEKNPEQALRLCTKIKLQLFPLDEVTREGLEKDGYHPYLELTLSSRKKISSVLKHLNHKWAGSSVVTEDPILLSYNISEDLGSCRWTLNDVGLSAGDVYAAIGSPSVFRLRYGWLSDCQNKSYKMPSTTDVESCSQPEAMQKACSDVGSMNSEGKQFQETREELKPAVVSRATDVLAEDKAPSNGFAETMQNNGKMQAGMGQSSLWDDSSTNISIGGLLSEASLQGRLNKSDGSNAGLHPSQLISDSFDAFNFIMSQVNRSQAPRLSHGTSSSILDAEDTCHAFAFQKFSSSDKDAAAAARSHTSSQDTILKSFKNPNISEVNIQSGLPQSPGCQESETDLSLCSRIYNDENSLGLSGIKWTDTLGPFDLGLTSSRKIISGDSLNISRIIS